MLSEAARTIASEAVDSSVCLKRPRRSETGAGFKAAEGGDSAEPVTLPGANPVGGRAKAVASAR